METFRFTFHYVGTYVYTVAGSIKHGLDYLSNWYILEIILQKVLIG